MCDPNKFMNEDFFWISWKVLLLLNFHDYKIYFYEENLTAKSKEFKANFLSSLLHVGKVKAENRSKTIHEKR